MTGEQLKAIREKLGLTLWDWGQVLGYTGNRNTVQVLLRRYETGERTPLPPLLERTALMFGRYGIPREYDLPQS
jgi:transcriptional regulator with XRE-family HTH domain